MVTSVLGNMSAPKVHMETIVELFGELKQSIDDFYNTHADLDAEGKINMHDILRNSAKLDYLLKGDYQELWRMERFERMYTQDKNDVELLEPIDEDKDEVESIDSHPSMPDLIPIQQLRDHSESFGSHPSMPELVRDNVPVNQHIFFDDSQSEISVICEDGPPVCTPVRNTILRQPPKLQRKLYNCSRSCSHT